MADQACDLPDAREQELRQPLRTVPRRRGHHGRQHARQGEAIAPLPRLAARRPRARSRLGLGRVQRRQARQLRDQPLRRPVGVHAVLRAGDPRVLALGQGVRAQRPLLLVGDGAVVPEPLLLHRGAVGRCVRQPGEHRDPAVRRDRGPARRWAFQELGVRRRADRRREGLHRRDRPAGGRAQAQHVLPHADGRRAAHEPWDRLAVLRAPARIPRVLLEPVQRRGRGVPHRPVERARATQHRRSDR